MTNYRNSKLVERYEDVVFELDKALNANPANGQSQVKEGYRFTVDNTGESTPFDWYHARFNVDINLEKLADGADVAANDHNGIVNSAFALIRKLNVKMNGVDVYDCSGANHATNIKNLLEYSRGYSKSQGTNEFFYIDTKRHPEERTAAAQAATYNSGFAARKLLLDAGATVNAEIPLNLYGFFESLHGELLPNSRIEFNIDIETDANLVWQAADDCRVVISKFQLIIPRIVFNSEGKSLYMSKYLDTRKWSYLREMVEYSNPTRQQTGTFKISSAINKPRHVFIFIINAANENVQTANKFLYNTFNVVDNKALNSCYLEVGNGKEYPEVHYRPHTEPTRVFRDLLKYVHANSDYAGDTLLTRTNFGSIFPLVYFDLTKQPTDIKDGMTRLTFKYTLSGGTNADYSVYALVLYQGSNLTFEVNSQMASTWSGSTSQKFVSTRHVYSTKKVIFIY